MMRIIDLSHTIEEGMPVYPGTKKPVIRKAFSVEQDGFMEHFLSFSTHTGTHLDVPAHLLTCGQSVEEFEASAFFGRAIKIDCRNMHHITITLIKNALKNSHSPDFIIFNTGWDSFWGDENYFHGFPILDSHAAESVASLPLKGVGIDAGSFDPASNTELKNHRILMKKNVLLIENLCNLSQLPDHEFLFSCFPLKIPGADGSPVRAIGLINQ